MYKQRLYIFISFCVFAIGVCIWRLADLQIVKFDKYRHQIQQMRILDPTQLPTVRGTIYDRNGKPLAIDRPAFFLHVNYQLTRLMDDRFWEASKLILTDNDKDGPGPEEIEIQLRDEYETDRGKLMRIINRFAELEENGQEIILDKIRGINDRIWKNREFHAWARGFPDSRLKAEYRQKGQFVPLSKGLEEFYQLVPSNEQRLKLSMKVDLADMHDYQPLIELKTEQELLEAQLAFVNVEGVEIFPEPKRVYPQDSAACQIIGWVGPAHEEDNVLFEDDYSRYLHGDVLGRDGLERVCEVLLRGRRGERVLDIDGNVIGRKPAVFGKDITLTLDIELQQQVERTIADPNGQRGAGAVVIDVPTGQILAMASVPVYDLNTIRSNYTDLLHDPARPMRSKTLYSTYPPGSTIKPIILAAGLGSNKISPFEVISCPHEPAPRGWPNCLQYARFHSCHDWKWQGQGGNIARNAIKGSCNIYFSRLADRLSSLELQEWLFKFGYGHEIMPGPELQSASQELERDKGTNRNLMESSGSIASSYYSGPVKSVFDLPPLKKYEQRMFGIGQGSLRATVLQVANAMAVLARDGTFISPTLYSGKVSPKDIEQYDLGLSAATVKTTLEGMYAVVNETGGTAYRAFASSALMDKSSEVRLYGKTGSTERPYHAWFSGFAKDSSGKAVSIAVVVEGGQAGSTDAAPLGRMIFEICNKMGYLGRPITETAVGGETELRNERIF